MPFDGIFTYAVCREAAPIIGARIDKIYQPENDELLLSFRVNGTVYRLRLNASAQAASFGFTAEKPETPLTPPAFCMKARKHFDSARLVSLKQIGFDRIVELTFETRNELGDDVTRRIVLEMMGKHSNLILIGEDGRVLDAAKHVSPLMSSVRVIQPGLPYEFPSHTHKAVPYPLPSEDRFREVMNAAPGPVGKALYTAFNGLSPAASFEICTRASLDERVPYSELSPEDAAALYQAFGAFFRRLTEEPPAFTVYYKPDSMLRYSFERSEARVLQDFTVFPYESLSSLPCEAFASAEEVLGKSFKQKGKAELLRQKAQDLSHLLHTNLERAEKKEALQLAQLKDAADRETDRLYGDLLTANLYRLKEGMRAATLENYYDEAMAEVTVPLDPQLSPAANAQRYYARYNKKKRTETAVTEQLASTREEIAYLKSLTDAMALADCEKDLADIRLELAETGYLKKPGGKARGKKNLAASKPLEFTTSEGVQVLVGKNNLQNDQLTFRIASPEDIWFHVKGMPGSHVILRIGEHPDYTEKSLLEAARIAAEHSSGSDSSKLEIDYTLRKYVKKPSGARPGFVRYTHQTTVTVTL